LLQSTSHLPAFLSSLSASFADDIEMNLKIQSK